MNQKKIRRYLISILVGCLTFSILTGSFKDRLDVEHDSKSYDVILDYDEMEALAAQSEISVSSLLKRFNDEIGISKVALMEENLSSLTQNQDINVFAYPVDMITKKANWKSDYPQEVLHMLEKSDKYDVLVEISDEYFKNFLFTQIRARFDENQYEFLDLGKSSFVLFDGNSKNALYSQIYKLVNSEKEGVIEKADVIGSKIMLTGLGLLPEKIYKIKSAGCEVIPRTLCYSGLNGKNFVSDFELQTRKYGISTEYLIPGGEAVMGNDDGIDAVKQYMDEYGSKLGLIETTTQRGNIMQAGIDSLVVMTNYKAVRVFSVWNYIQYRYKVYGYEGAKEIENTLFRAVTERNIRLIYFKPIKENQDLYTYVTNFEEYRELFSNLANRLAEHGFVSGSASVMGNVKSNPISEIALGFALISAVLLLISTLIELNLKKTGILAIIGAAGICAAKYVMPNSFILFLSFMTAVIFACLAITVFLFAADRVQYKFAQDAGVWGIVIAAAAVLIVSVMVALVGATFTASILSKNSFMLEMDIFRGVKVAQLIPLVYFFLVYAAYFGFGKKKKKHSGLEIQDIKAMLLTDVKIWMAIVAVVLGAVGTYYIMRTGHESNLEVSSVEMLFRNYLEDHLIARPRNKEFLFAFPSLMISIYMFARRQKLPALIFGLCSVVGLTSVINTFMHIRTPLYLGYFRTACSLQFGIFLGIVAIVMIEICKLIWKKYIKL